MIGYVFEVRIYVENVSKGFFLVIGVFYYYRFVFVLEIGVVILFVYVNRILVFVYFYDVFYGFIAVY